MALVHQRRSPTRVMCGACSITHKPRPAIIQPTYKLRRATYKPQLEKRSNSSAIGNVTHHHGRRRNTLSRGVYSSLFAMLAMHLLCRQSGIWQQGNPAQSPNSLLPPLTSPRGLSHPVSVLVLAPISCAAVCPQGKLLYEGEKGHTNWHAFG